MSQKYRFKVDKLIRDKFSEVMTQKEITISTRTLEKDEYIKRLGDKLLEEAQEANETKNQAHKIEELADVLEVIHSMCLVEGISYQIVEEARIKKYQEKGGFEERTYCEFVEMDENNKKASYYLAQPDRYPKIPLGE